MAEIELEIQIFEQYSSIFGAFRATRKFRVNDDVWVRRTPKDMREIFLPDGDVDWYHGSIHGNNVDDIMPCRRAKGLYERIL